MSKEVTYNINDVVGRLSDKIANLEVQLAHGQATIDAYVKRIAELEQELEDIDMAGKEQAEKISAE
ncbi:hypothetical protein [Pseudogracilibacillus auburnensis]|uniref:hypothetical protein n=1 Tax=Pseudogracilibacillus auburnensis TaxID=1494959 RepID=UPI001A978A4D|nr:hypothetical protein [Pseudogracilibacillus auburnensis]MBO1002667.1 hypothetical protein [Pseudogracilibacillus auburnensis]